MKNDNTTIDSVFSGLTSLLGFSILGIALVDLVRNSALFRRIMANPEASSHPFPVPTPNGQKTNAISSFDNTKTYQLSSFSRAKWSTNKQRPPQIIGRVKEKKIKQPKSQRQLCTQLVIGARATFRLLGTRLLWRWRLKKKKADVLALYLLSINILSLTTLAKEASTNRPDQSRNPKW